LYLTQSRRAHRENRRQEAGGNEKGKEKTANGEHKSDVREQRVKSIGQRGWSPSTIFRAYGVNFASTGKKHREILFRN